MNAERHENTCSGVLTLMGTWLDAKMKSSIEAGNSAQFNAYEEARWTMVKMIKDAGLDPDNIILARNGSVDSE